MSAKWIGIVVLVAIVVGAAAGYAGYSTGVQAGLQQAQNIRNQFFADRGGGQGGGFGGAGGQGGTGAGAGGQGGANRQFNANNFAAGQVKSVSGNTVQLSTANEVLNVKLTDQTQIQKMGEGTLSDIQTGERITVQGSRAADGSFTAQTVQIGGGFGGFGGRGASANGTPGANGGGTRGGAGGGAGAQAGATPQAQSAQ